MTDFLVRFKLYCIHKLMGSEAFAVLQSSYVFADFQRKHFSREEMHELTEFGARRKALDYEEASQALSRFIILCANSLKSDTDEDSTPRFH